VDYIFVLWIFFFVTKRPGDLFYRSIHSSFGLYICLAKVER
jgi:hypothetical protein